MHVKPSRTFHKDPVKSSFLGTHTLYRPDKVISSHQKKIKSKKIFQSLKRCHLTKRQKFTLRGRMNLLCGFMMSLTWALSSSASSLLHSRQAAADWATIACPPDPKSDYILPTPTYGDAGGKFSVCAQQDINAPAQAVYDTLIDFKSYPAWNTFAFQIDVPADVTATPQDVYVGMPIVQHTTGLVPIINTTDDLIVSVLDDDSSQGYLMPAWKSNTTFLGVLLPTEHNNILTNLGAGGTRYVSYQTFYEDELGLENVELLLRGNLQSGFEQQGDDLKTYMESK